MTWRRRDRLDCPSALALIESHLEEGSSASPSDELAAHLERCESCRAELELAEALRTEMGRLPRFDTPDRVIEAARRTIGRDARPSRPATPGRWRLRPRTALAAAAVAIMAVTAMLVGPERPRETQRASESEIAQATAEARLAFALIADATERAELELRDSVLRDRVIATAVRGVSKSFRLRSTLGRPSDQDPTPTTHGGGST